MTPLEIACNYISRGWNPVPCDYKSKIPIGEEWQLRVIDASNAAQYFNTNPQNIGVAMGPTSKGLTDADLDCAEAVAIAPYILPRTNAIFGHASRPLSHWLYCTNLGTTADTAVYRFCDPKTKGTLLELRIGGGGKGAQTIFPGSMHDTGEPVTWHENGEPAAVTDLGERVHLLAACCLLARYWPQVHGARHEYALVVGGFLSRAGKDPAQIKVAVEAITRAAGDEEWRDRRKAAEDAANAHHEGKRTYGLKALRDLYGQQVADQIAEWLNYREADERSADPVEQIPLPDLCAPYVWRDPATLPIRGWLYGKHYIRQLRVRQHRRGRRRQIHSRVDRSRRDGGAASAARQNANRTTTRCASGTGTAKIPRSRSSCGLPPSVSTSNSMAAAWRESFSSTAATARSASQP